MERMTSELKITPANNSNIESPIKRYKQRLRAKPKGVTSKFINAGLGSRLRQWRKAEELTLMQLAKKLRIGVTTLSEIETDKSFPSAHTLGRLHIRTNLNIFYLMFNEGDMLKGDKPVKTDKVVKKKKVVKQTIFNMKLPIKKNSS